MAELLLTQNEADELIEMEKYISEKTEWSFPEPGESIVVPLASKDKRETFILDVARGRISLEKATFQNRARKVIVLMRLDIAGPPHCNPDGEEIPCPHLHIYREGFGTKWAIKAPVTTYPDPADLRSTLGQFMTHCNIVDPPNFQSAKLQGELF